MPVSETAHRIDSRQVQALLVYDPPFRWAPHNTVYVVVRAPLSRPLPGILVDNKLLWGLDPGYSKLVCAEAFNNIGSRI